MNPDRFADDRDFPSNSVGYGMSMNAFSRMFEIQRNLDQIRSSVEDLDEFREQREEGNLSRDTATGAVAAVKQLMRALDSIEYAFPELVDEVWFSGFKQDVHHAYWRIEDGRFDGVLDMERDSIRGFSTEVEDILANISESINTNPIYQLQRFLRRYGEEFYPLDAPEEYHNEVFEARDLFCLGYYSTGLIVLGRAVERALLQLGQARKINSVDGFRDSTEWEEARFFERAKALYNINRPDQSGKMISKRQYHLVQLLIDYRNKVAHEDYRSISKDSAARMMGQALDLLSEVEETRSDLEELPDDEIPEMDNVSVPL